MQTYSSFLSFLRDVDVHAASFNLESLRSAVLYLLCSLKGLGSYVPPAENYPNPVDDPHSVDHDMTRVRDR